MTWSEAEVRGEIRRLAREELGLEWDGADDEPLAARLDSLALLSLVVAIEDRFRLKLTEDDGETTRSLADLARLVLHRAAGDDGVEASP